MEQEPAPRLRPLDEPAQAGEDRRLGRPLIHQQPDLLPLEPEVLEEHVPDIRDVVHTSLQVRPRHPVAVDPDKQCALGHASLLSIANFDWRISN